MKEAYSNAIRGISKDAEQQTMMTLWSISSPLMFEDMTQLDEWTLSLLNNEEINATHLKLLIRNRSIEITPGYLKPCLHTIAMLFAVFNISDTVAVLPEELKTNISCFRLS